MKIAQGAPRYRGVPQRYSMEKAKEIESRFHWTSLIPAGCYRVRENKRWAVCLVHFLVCDVLSS